MDSGTLMPFQPFAFPDPGAAIASIFSNLGHLPQRTSIQVPRSKLCVVSCNSHYRWLLPVC